MMRLPLDGVCCLDFEASGLGDLSYPIEAAVVDCATVQCQSWLIRPSSRWASEGAWSAEAAKLHHIEMSELLVHGVAIAQVAAELAAACQGKRVLCDGREHDQRWLTTLFAGAGRNVPFLIHDFDAYAAELARRAGRDANVASVNDDLAARKCLRVAHRAEPDARLLAERLRLIAGWT
jgi:hypothetical protein